MNATPIDSGDHTAVSGWLAAAEAEWTPARGLVLAVDCTDGHPNAPHRTACGVCGAPVQGDARQVPRPSLGVLRLPDGERIELLQPLVIGRNPRADRAHGSEAPRLVPVSHGHVSASHVEIRLDGWSVLAVDLHSRNGTFLRRRGTPPVRLGVQAELLAAGDVLDLGHGVQFTVEELR